MEDYIGTEKVVHGQRWGGLHGGYFSDPTIARPLVETVRGLLAKAPAEVVVDLGGGTGFLLSQLAAQGVGVDAALVDVDCSESQLALTREEGITAVCTSLGGVRRGDVAAEGKRLFFMMRSVLHYLGEDGLSPLLRHLRDQAEGGEYFVHQSASFASEEEAAGLNLLYREMRTRKWYPTVNELQRRLTDSGWRVTATTQAPSLLLTSDDLARRYALDQGDIARIREVMTKTFGERNSVFRLTSSGFSANLHYRIYTCVATPLAAPLPRG